MNMPGFSAQAALYRSGRGYYRARTDAIAFEAHASVGLATILSGGCDFNVRYSSCADVLDTCEYYAALTPGFDASNCCRYHVAYCQVPPTPVLGGSSPGIGGGVGGGSPEGGPGTGLPFKPFTRPQ
jgi:hypothetical protein